ncbi:hypothetical protein [Petrachloros mirabilis]
MKAHRIFSFTAFAIPILIVSCAAPTAQQAAPTQTAPQIASPTQAAVPTVAPAPTTTQTAVPTKAAVPTLAPSPTAAQTAVPTKATQSTGTTKLNMDEIFPPGPGREAVLDNCTTCHTFVPLVILQYGQAQWDLSARNHRDRVPGMSDADFKAAYEYLAKNFNPDHPVPDLPRELLDTWTDY